jgi:hypothetical protein
MTELELREDEKKKRRRLEEQEKRRQERLEKRLTRREAAEYLTERGYRTSRTTLAKLACIGGGPRYAKFGCLALYTMPDLEDWALSRLRHHENTSRDQAVR